MLELIFQWQIGHLRQGPLASILVARVWLRCQLIPELSEWITEHSGTQHAVVYTLSSSGGAKGTDAEMKEQLHCTGTVHEWMNRCVEGRRAAADAKKPPPPPLWFNVGKIWQQRQIAWQIVTKCHTVVKRAGVRRKRRWRQRWEKKG